METPTLILLALFAQTLLIIALVLLVLRLKRTATKKEALGSRAKQKEEREEILRGLENEEFKMFLQFVVDIKDNGIVSAEALSRWETNNGILPPGAYIDKMERMGLISKHDFYMLELVCRQLEKWKETPLRDLSISCNFTRITLSEKNFVERIEEIAQKYSFDKSKLTIEITEDAIEKDTEVAQKNVSLLKELGIKIYLDDLGSGYTSLANLCDYPIDVVKIDRYILQKTNTPRGKSLFSGIVALAHSLNLLVICEGVETEEQNLLVSESDCDFIQGWYYSKPIPVAEAEDFIEKHNFKYK